MTSQENNQHINTMKSRYQRAKTIIEGFSSKSLVQNDSLFPQWIEDTNCFWYERTTKSGKKPQVEIGKEYRLVDARRQAIR